MFIHLRSLGGCRQAFIWQLLYPSGGFLAGEAGCCWPVGLVNGASSISPQIRSGALLPSQCLFVRAGRISGDPAVWKGASTWVLFKEGHVAMWRNYNPGSLRGSDEIGWLGSQESSAAGGGLGKGIRGLSCYWRCCLPRQELSVGRVRAACGANGTGCGMGVTDWRGRRAELMPAGHGTLAPPAQPSRIPPAVLLCPLHPLSLAQSLDALPDIQKTDVRSPEVFPGVTIDGRVSIS